MLFVSLLVTLVIARRGASTTTTSDLADATDVLRSARYPYAWGLGFPFGDEETELTSAAPAKKKSVKEVKAVKLGTFGTRCLRQPDTEDVVILISIIALLTTRHYHSQKANKETRARMVRRYSRWQN